MIYEKAHGIIFSLKPQGEYDRVILLFSEEEGIVRIVAKGVRKHASRRGFALDILQYVTLEIERSKTNVYYLREITIHTSYSFIKKNPDAYCSACLIISFLLKILPRQHRQKNIFELTEKLFAGLEKGKDSRALLKIYFLKCLRLLGYITPHLKLHDIPRSLNYGLTQVDSEFILRARRTLGTFSS